MSLYHVRQILRKIFKICKELGPGWCCTSIFFEGNELKGVFQQQQSPQHSGAKDG